MAASPSAPRCVLRITLSIEEEGVAYPAFNRCILNVFYRNRSCLQSSIFGAIIPKIPLIRIISPC